MQKESLILQFLLCYFALLLYVLHNFTCLHVVLAPSVRKCNVNIVMRMKEKTFS